LLGVSTTAKAVDDLVEDQFKDLLPFEVTLVLQSENATVKDFEVRRITARWMTDVFEAGVTDLGADYKLVQTIVQTYGDPIQEGRVFSGSYDGISFWSRDSPIPNADVVVAMQIQGIVNDADTLLQMLREGSEDDGLGSNVVDVKPALIDAPAPDDANGGSDDQLDVVIIVAIVIAVLAFLLLSFAIFMAWRQNQQRNAAFKADPNRDPNSPTGTGASETDEVSPRKGSNNDDSQPPSEIAPSDLGGGLYPDSVISEDITTSLSAYYSSGLAKDKNYNRLAGAGAGAGGLNDAASVSSMESYGYSLDGYANSIANQT
jgi:hypothetical protein